MVQALLLSTLLTGVLVLAVVALVVRSVEWRDYAPESPDGPGLLRRARGSQTVWILAFLLLLAVFGGGSVAYVSGALSAPMVKAAGLVLAGATALVVSAYLFYGTYAAARGRGRPSSVAVAEGAILVGVLFLLAITGRLVFVA